jgi:transposase
LSENSPKRLISQEEIRAVYERGEEAVIELVEGLIAGFLEQIEKLESRVKELEGQLSKNSQNSSKPPSGDGFGKKTKSLRSKSELKTGGQPEHPGFTLEWSSEVDAVVEHKVRQCQGCGSSLEEEPLKDVVARQVYDIPPIVLQVTEHRAEVKSCPHCGLENQANFPAEANSLVQYGSRLKSMMVYFMDGQLLPFERTCEVLSDILGKRVSEGTLYNTRTQCFKHLEPLTSNIQLSIIASDVVHFDETGLRVNGKLWWLHVACTDGLTYYFVHSKRGQVAMNEMDILPQFEGKAIHDGWTSYEEYSCEHFLCNAHHLRELKFIWEQYEQSWALQMSLLLCSIKRQVDEAQENDQKCLPLDVLNAFEARYQAILEQGFTANPIMAPPPPKTTRKKRGRPKQSPPRNLLDRLRTKQASVLGFMYDFDVPFDNNQAERDIRMMKLKQKISGTFRSPEGAQIFCRIRGYISTLRKQGCHVLDALIALFSGDFQSPIPQPE